MLISFEWLAPIVAIGIFIVMFTLGLRLGTEQIAAALQRRGVLAAALFAVIVPVPALAVLAVKLLGVKGVVAAGIVLMAISPGAPVALRRALDAGGHRDLAPALHLAVVMLAVVSVPAFVLVLDWIFDKDFSVTPLQIGRQVFFAQLLPMSLGAALRARRPAFAARIEPGVARISNGLILVISVLVLFDLPGIIGDVGWLPTVAGIAMTVCALAIGAAFAGRDLEVRPAAAVAAAMRNPGLALVIATVNRFPPGVVQAVIGYTLGMGLVIFAFLQWRRRRHQESRRLPG
jgi:BASS family bile acid:Na+ symporter